MKKQNQKSKRTHWKKVAASMLAACVCISSMETGALAASPVQEVKMAKGQSPWELTEDIILSEKEMLLPIGDSAYLDVFYDYYNEEDDSYEYYDMDVIWSSSDNRVVSVDEDGEVKAKKAGTATVTAKTESGTTASCKVTVAEVLLNKTLNVTVGQTKALTFKKIYPKSDKVAKWRSNNTKVATIKNGKVTGKKTGKATITVTMKSGATASCKVTVKQATTKSLSFPKKYKRITIMKGKSMPLTVIRNPKNSTGTITWKSSAPKIVTVNKKGIITAKKAGTAVINAKLKNNKKATCKVTVKEPAVKKPKVTLKKNKATLKVGQKTKIQIKSVSIKKDKVKSYKSDKPKVASVNKKGLVTAKKVGTAKITVTTKKGAKAIFKVTVKKKTTKKNKKK